MTIDYDGTTIVSLTNLDDINKGIKLVESLRKDVGQAAATIGEFVRSNWKIKDLRLVLIMKSAKLTSAKSSRLGSLLSPHPCRRYPKPNFYYRGP
jgi:hypothetical protein